MALLCCCLKHSVICSVSFRGFASQNERQHHHDAGIMPPGKIYSLRLSSAASLLGTMVDTTTDTSLSDICLAQSGATSLFFHRTFHLQLPTCKPRHHQIYCSSIPSLVDCSKVAPAWLPEHFSSSACLGPSVICIQLCFYRSSSTGCGTLQCCAYAGSKAIRWVLTMLQNRLKFHALRLIFLCLRATPRILWRPMTYQWTSVCTKSFTQHLQHCRVPLQLFWEAFPLSLVFVAGTPIFNLQIRRILPNLGYIHYNGAHKHLTSAVLKKDSISRIMAYG